jgi:hypothetical protein
MRLCKDDVLYEELRFKCKLEIALYYKRHDMTREAQKEAEEIIKKCPKSLIWYAEEAEQILRTN